MERDVCSSVSEELIADKVHERVYSIKAGYVRRRGIGRTTGGTRYICSHQISARRTIRRSVLHHLYLHRNRQVVSPPKSSRRNASDQVPVQWEGDRRSGRGVLLDPRRRDESRAHMGVGQRIRRKARTTVLS